MCGIAGLQLSQGYKPEQLVLEAFAKALHHRGPDDAGIEIYDHSAFVHTRLSIIDLNNGHQPLKSNRGDSLIVNGEIYNYKELYNQFCDYPFYTASDCEPILALYQRYGLNFVNHLRGMYAIALYDSQTQRLILARDPFGIKPLYYTKIQQGIAFSSELQAFINSRLVQPLIRPHVRAELLQLRYNTGADTIFGGIQRVLPGEVIVIENGTIIERYIHKALSKKPLSKTITNEEKAIQELGNVLQDSVNVHLRSDVPYGLFLSGGLDSATLLHLMSQSTGQSIKTYTIGFSNTAVHDEREQARSLSKLYNTEHTELEYTETDFWRDLPVVTAIIDDPIFDQAMLPTYKLAGEARKNVKVILCGEGGDELLCGYRRYQKALWPWWLGGRVMREKGTLTKAGINNSHFDDWQTPLQNLKTEFDQDGFFNKLQMAQALDCASWLPNNLLIKLDRCLMAYGLEGRTPFIDPLVSEFCFNLPNKFKIHRGYGKWLLRQWLNKNMPASKPFAKKQGFRVPVEEWIMTKGPRLSHLVARQPGIEELFDNAIVKDIFITPSSKTSYSAWMLLVYAVWHQIYVIGKPTVPDTLSMLS